MTHSTEHRYVTLLFQELLPFVGIIEFLELIQLVDREIFYPGLPETINLRRRSSMLAYR